MYLAAVLDLYARRVVGCPLYIQYSRSGLGVNHILKK